ncbi:MAG: hypothetical protein R3A12_11780 [Ignavibacteria bacterium]
MEKVFDGLTLEDVNKIYPIDKFAKMSLSFYFLKTYITSVISHRSDKLSQKNS